MKLQTSTKWINKVKADPESYYSCLSDALQNMKNKPEYIKEYQLFKF